jgi:hypothetical protein
MGASDKSDRATHEPSPQAVLAVPVGIPSAEEMLRWINNSSPVSKDAPVAFMQWNEGGGTWEQVIPEAGAEPGVEPFLRQAALLEWLRQSPNDWPWTGHDIANFIEGGILPWA